LTKNLSHAHGHMGDLNPSDRHLVVIENDDLFDRVWYANSRREPP